jgi:hypothetical protein
MHTAVYTSSLKSTLLEFKVPNSSTRGKINYGAITVCSAVWEKYSISLNQIAVQEL